MSIMTYLTQLSVYLVLKKKKKMVGTWSLKEIYKVS